VKPTSVSATVLKFDGVTVRVAVPPTSIESGEKVLRHDRTGRRLVRPDVVVCSLRAGQTALVDGHRRRAIDARSVGGGVDGHASGQQGVRLGRTAVVRERPEIQLRRGHLRERSVRVPSVSKLTPMVFHGPRFTQFPPAALLATIEFLMFIACALAL
jgi:hypothetical protein